MSEVCAVSKNIRCVYTNTYHTDLKYVNSKDYLVMRVFLKKISNGRVSSENVRTSMNFDHLRAFVIKVYKVSIQLKYYV